MSEIISGSSRSPDTRNVANVASGCDASDFVVDVSKILATFVAYRAVLIDDDPIARLKIATPLDLVQRLAQLGPSNAEAVAYISGRIGDPIPNDPRHR